MLKQNTGAADESRDLFGQPIPPLVSFDRGHSVASVPHSAKSTALPLPGVTRIESGGQGVNCPAGSAPASGGAFFGGRHEGT